MPEPENKVLEENEPPDVIAHEADSEEGPCDAFSCGTFYAEE